MPQTWQQLSGGSLQRPAWPCSWPSTHTQNTVGAAHWACTSVWYHSAESLCDGLFLCTQPQRLLPWTGVGWRWRVQTWGHVDPEVSTCRSLASSLHLIYELKKKIKWINKCSHRLLYCQQRTLTRLFTNGQNVGMLASLSPVGGAINV